MASRDSVTYLGCCGCLPGCAQTALGVSDGLGARTAGNSACGWDEQLGWCCGGRSPAEERTTQPCACGALCTGCIAAPHACTSTYVHALIRYLNSELVAGVAPVHLRAGQVKLPFIESSPTVDVVGDLVQDLLIDCNALHT